MRAALRTALICLSVAFATSPVVAFDHALVARNAVEKHIRPGYQRFNKAMATLDNGMKAFCADQQEASLARAKKAFADAVGAWSRVEHIRFGPVAEEHRYERIAFWPDPKGIGARQVSRGLSKNDPTLTKAETLAQKSVALQGLTALERVIYGGSGLLGQKSGFRCMYAMAITANLAAIASAVDAAWNLPEGYSKLMLNPGGENPVYFEPQEVTQELVMAYATGLMTVRNLKIGAPLGLVQSGKVNGAEFADSGLDRAVIIGNLEGLRDLLAISGLAAEISKEEGGEGRALLNEFDIALKTMRNLKLPIDELPKNPKAMQRFAVIGFALKNAYETGVAQMKAAAGLSMGFNSLDGD